MLVAIGLHLALGLPDGALGHRARRGIVIAGYVGGARARGVLLYARAARRSARRRSHRRADRGAFVGVIGYVRRCRGARTAQARARLQWVAWGVVVAAAISLGAVVLNALLSLAGAGRRDRGRRRRCSCRSRSRSARPISSRSASTACSCTRITLAGLVGLVAACRTCSSCSGSAASRPATSRRCSGCRCSRPRSPRCCGFPPASGSPSSRRAASTASGHAPDEVLRTFGSRLTRALPLDELLLQLAESLKKTMYLDGRRGVDTGAGRPRARGVGARPRAGRLALGTEEETVVAHAGVSGPGVGAGLAARGARRPRGRPVLRVAPVTNSGELLGMIVVRRPEGALPFNEADDQALTELARQVGLALHNVKLDSALQESLDEVRRQADELPRLARPHRRGRPTPSGAASSATSTTARSSTSSRSR